ncbi:MAG: mannitol dehydrogenase [Candidatus Nephthysia bennettiae]|uniref:Mannitol-1-phosphate 5-dehydrogenase n=1 Tax=Candidatus Nephthysia bennettiae TaxID=3127016 RepID=A0A934KDF2_9BACT|nr:mannitol dehydrogenase family protein [Candidatus Dormibacteraeota bacterium]PZR91002.1 MAG: mannitol dehydrogenase [Candidatus Dormibacteraeota bacterium]
MTPLDATTVGGSHPHVAVPAYDRTTVTPGIVHFGVGAFHRSHEAMYIDRILNAGYTDWGICGVGVTPYDTAIRDVLREQDYLYTLITVTPDGTAEARVIGSVVDFLYAPDNPAAALEKLVDPATRIVSLTITEGGYSINDATGEFDPHDPGTLADLAAGDSTPKSVLGFIVAALKVRKAMGTPPFTVMSCDNIQGNGGVARKAVVAFAERKDPQHAAWIADNVPFPNSMVDRITPATTDQTRASVAADYGITDAWPIRSEAFEQWVLEDRFSCGRPPLETAGVQIVDDVEPYELMKLRLLNASHQAMSYLGLLAGATYVHEVCRDPLFVNFLLGYMHKEAIPTLRPVPGIDLSAYCDQLIARFGGEVIQDTLARQVIDGSDRIPKFLLPVVAEQLAHGRDIGCCALVLAAWSHFLGGATKVAPVDKRLAELQSAVADERHHPGAFLSYRPVFGDLGSHPILKAAFVEARAAIGQDGARAAIAAL